MTLRSLGTILIALLLFPGCGGDDTFDSTELEESEAEFAEEAILEDREAFQRSALEYIGQLQERIRQLDDRETIDPSTLRALKSQAAHAYENIRELDDVTAVAYRDLHDVVLHRLYQLDSNITQVMLESAQEPTQLQQLARQRLTALGEEIDTFEEMITRRGRDPQTPHAIDLGKMKKQYSILAQRISSLSADTVDFEQVRAEIAEDMGELVVTVRQSKDLVEYPELGQ